QTNTTFITNKPSKNYHPVHPLILDILILTIENFRYPTIFNNLLIYHMNYRRSRGSLDAN
ncbi:hypothetical protein QHH03_22450, partial [Aphanizomenon sp. 202]|nr:hypothetical protein [Aphanizomenon sp. 202]